MKKKLIEMYGLKEGPFDDINKQLGSAQSVARDPRAPQQQQRTRVGQSGAAQKAQADLDQSKSIFDEGMGELELTLTDDEAEALLQCAQALDDPNMIKSVPGLASATLKLSKLLGKGGSANLRKGFSYK